VASSSSEDILRFFDSLVSDVSFSSLGIAEPEIAEDKTASIGAVRGVLEPGETPAELRGLLDWLFLPAL
jgi:hypothetical protein